MAASDPADQIARWMRAAREDAGLTTYDVAGRMNVTQSRVSRLERGLSPPTPELVRAWAKATGGDPGRAGRMADLADGLSHPWATRAGRESGTGRRDRLTPRQQEMARIRQGVTVYRELAAAAVPVLLQIPAYATALLELVGQLAARPDMAAVVAGRMNSQEILYDGSRTFSFLVTEAALGFRAGSPEVMTAQAEKIVSVMTLPNVTVAVLPASARLPIPLQSAFVIYEIPEDPLVMVELLPGEVSYTQAGDVGLYQEAFRVLQGHAITGRSAAVTLIRSVMSPGP